MKTMFFLINPLYCLFILPETIIAIIVKLISVALFILLGIFLISLYKEIISLYKEIGFIKFTAVLIIVPFFFFLMKSGMLFVRIQILIEYFLDFFVVHKILLRIFLLFCMACILYMSIQIGFIKTIMLLSYVFLILISCLLLVAPCWFTLLLMGSTGRSIYSYFTIKDEDDNNDRKDNPEE